MRKKNRNPASKESRELREKVKGGLPDGALVFLRKRMAQSMGGQDACQ